MGTPNYFHIFSILKNMETTVPISIKRLATEQLAKVQAGQVSRDEAERLLKEQVRHSSKTRADLIEELARNYDAEAVEALEYFRLI